MGGGPRGLQSDGLTGTMVNGLGKEANLASLLAVSGRSLPDYQEVTQQFAHDMSTLSQQIVAAGDSAHRQRLYAVAVGKLSADVYPTYSQEFRVAVASAAHQLLRQAFGSVDDERMLTIVDRISSGVQGTERMERMERMGKARGERALSTRALLRSLIDNPPVTSPGLPLAHSA